MYNLLVVLIYRLAPKRLLFVSYKSQKRAAKYIIVNSSMPESMDCLHLSLHLHLIYSLDEVFFTPL